MRSPSAAAGGATRCCWPVIAAVLHHVPDPHARRGRRSSTTTARSVDITEARSGWCAEDGRRAGTRPGSVIAGITYNFLPFMILPLYASLERIDKRMLEAGVRPVRDASRTCSRRVDAAAVDAGGGGRRRCSRSFRPPATSSTRSCSARRSQTMIGNVIQSRYLEVTDYPTAAALSFILMADHPRAGGDLGADRRHGGAHGRGGRVDGGGHAIGAARPAGLAPAARPPRRAALDAALKVYAALALLYLLVPIAVIIAVLVQRHREPLQLRLAGLHARPLEGPVRRSRGWARRWQHSLEIAGALHDRRRPSLGHDDGAGARPLRVPRPRRP